MGRRLRERGGPIATHEVEHPEHLEEPRRVLGRFDRAQPMTLEVVHDPVDVAQPLHEVIR